MTMEKLLDFIAEGESRGDYNVVYGKIKKRDLPPKPLIKMSIKEVLDWQDKIDPRYRSEAAGKYQILEDTLRGLYRSAGLGLHDLFNADNQDRLAVQLLKRRGLDDYAEGKISPARFALSLSKEWASLPVPYDTKGASRNVKRGQSYYAGDGLNKASADVDEFLSAIRASLDISPPAVDYAPTKTLSATPKRTTVGLTAGGIFAAGTALWGTLQYFFGG